MIYNFIIGTIFSIISGFVILFNYKKMMIFNCNKFISTILLIILICIDAGSKSINGYFSIISAIITGILGPINLSLLIYIIWGKSQIK